MAIAHKKYFDDLITALRAVDASAVIAVVSQDGLVLASNKQDSELEVHLAALASFSLDTASRLFAIPDMVNGDKVDATRTLLAVGDNRYVCVIRLYPTVIVTISGTDKSKIAAVMKQGLASVDDALAKIAAKELYL